MSKSMRPAVIVSCVADHFVRESDNKRIIEFTDAATQCGGLISFTRLGRELVIEVYRCNTGVRVAATDGAEIHLERCECRAPVKGPLGICDECQKPVRRFSSPGECAPVECAG